MRVSSKRLEEAEQKAKKLLKKMNITEKVGQLSQFGTSIYSDRINYLEDHYNEGKLGSYLWVFGAEITNEVQKKAVEKIPNHIPVIFAHDVIHGYKTIFPIPLAQSCSWNPEVARICCEVSAKESYCAGIRWVFSPMVDIAHDPRWGRIAEGYGEDSYLCSLFSAAAVDGYEGKEIGEKYRVLSCLKHFAAYGACQGGRDYNAADISIQNLFNDYLPSFKSGVDAGCATIMTAFNSLNGVPCTANEFLLKTILRDEWKFDGLTISDASAVSDLVAHGFAEDIKDAAKKAFNAGVDINMAGENYNDSLPSLIECNKISEDQLNASVLKVLTLKYLLGLFDNPYVDPKEEKCFLSPEHLKKAEETAEECVVLLKNKNDTLPLKQRQKIAVIGPFAYDKNNVGGSWAYTDDGYVSILEGITNYSYDSNSISYALGCAIDNPEKCNPSELAEALSVAENSDIIILALGEPSNESGEAKSKASLRLNPSQLQLLDEMLKLGKPIVILITAGRPIILEDYKDKAEAIMYIWQLGTCTGNAVAKNLFGICNPSGHLTVSIPHTEGQIPINYNHTSTGHPALGKVWYESKYLDAPVEPDFCFGYGLSYTEFRLSDLKLSSNKMSIDGEIKIKLTVNNIGRCDGKALVQLYTNDVTASIVRPVKELKGFRKIMIKTGEAMDVEFTLKASDLGFYNNKMEYLIEPGKFRLFIGQSSTDNALTSEFYII